MKYFLAYDNNLCKSEMKARCPDAQAVGDAVIKDWVLAFRQLRIGAKLTIEPKKGSVVPVGVWAISEDDEKRLDDHYFCPNYFKKMIMQVKMYDYMTNEYKIVNAVVYIMQGQRYTGIPSSRYMNIVSAGYMDFGFDSYILARAYYTQSYKAGNFKRGGAL